MTTTPLTEAKEPKQQRSRPIWIDLALLAVVVAIFAIPLALRLNTDGQPEGESYAGSDSSATTKIEELNPDYEPWFTPLFEPSSGEVESGLFALQAAVGAGILGFVLGRLSGRRRASATPAGTTPLTEPTARDTTARDTTTPAGTTAPAAATRASTATPGSSETATAGPARTANPEGS